jgi:peroxiredoxin Q/BCP
MKTGMIAHDFSLLDSEGKIQTLSSFYGKPVVLYFYPKDNTPGCTKQACGFRDRFDIFNELGITVIGISKDSVESHKKFKEEHQLPFILLSDLEGKVVEAYGVWVEKSMYGKTYMGIKRSTFVIDASGIISHIFEQASPDTNASDIIEAIRQNN